jgi:hypothetical protein
MHAWAFHRLHEISIPKRVRHHLEPEWEMRRTERGGSMGALCTGFTLVYTNRLRQGPSSNTFIEHINKSNY